MHHGRQRPGPSRRLAIVRLRVFVAVVVKLSGYKVCDEIQGKTHICFNELLFLNFGGIYVGSQPWSRLANYLGLF